VSIISFFKKMVSFFCPVASWQTKIKINDTMSFVIKLHTTKKAWRLLGELAFLQPITEAKLLIKSLKFIQMSNRIPSSPNWCKIVLQKLRLIPSSPNNAKPNVGSSFSLLVIELAKVFVHSLRCKSQFHIYLHRHN